MKKLLLLLFIIKSFSSTAQITAIVGTDNGTNSTTDYPCPIQDFYYATHAQYLYTAVELNALGIAAGCLITEIGWVVNATPITGHLSEGYTISLLNTSIPTLNTSFWETGAIPVYGPQDYNYPSGYSGNVMFNVNPFYYSGGNLIVDICGGFSTGGFVDNPMCHWTTGLPFNASHQWRQDAVDGCGNPAVANSGIETTRPLLVVTYLTANTELPTVEGDVYYDQNQSGTRDFNEIGLANRFVTVGPQGYLTLTNATGHYKCYLDTGSYNVSWLPAMPWILTTSPATYFVSTPPNSLNNDFGIWTADSVVDYTQLVGYINGIMRCNMEGMSTLNINNSSVYAENGSVTLIHSANLPFNGATSTPGYTINGDTVRWTYSNLLPGQNIAFHGNFNNGPAGDTITYTYIDSVFDGTIFRRVYTNSFTFILSCSFDPNDKAVDPPGEMALHYTLMDEELQYTIRFQNTGNDTAFNVQILDILDPNLNISTLQVIASSHPISLQMTPAGALQFTFANILLPDSIVDEPNSHGYVVYKIHPYGGLAEGTVIYNNAQIIFDMNPPVITNTTFNTMVTQIPTKISEVSLNEGGFIYPNPATDEAWIYLYQQNQDKHQLFVFNSIGKKMLAETFTGNQYLLNEKLPQGIYLVSVCDEDGKMIFTSRLVKQ